MPSAIVKGFYEGWDVQPPDSVFIHPDSFSLNLDLDLGTEPWLRILAL